MIERELILKLKELKSKKETLTESLKTVNKEIDETEQSLIDFLNFKDAKASAKYEGIGWVQINKPRIMATCHVADMEKIKEYLKEIGRLDLITTRVMPQTLSKFVEEQIEQGHEIPEFIHYYFKENLGMYNS